MVSRKRKEKKRPLYVFLTIIISLIIVYLGLNIKDAWSKYSETRKRLDVSAEVYESLRQRHSELEKEKEFQESSTGQESQIRTKFDFVRPGEQAVLIIHEDVPQIVEEETRIQRFFNTFKNFFN